MSNKVIKSVSLNVTNAEDAAILKAVKRRNFSGYVKGLIMADLRAKEAAAGQQGGEAAPEAQPEPVKQLSAAERLEEMKRQRSGPRQPAQTKPYINPLKN